MTSKHTADDKPITASPIDDERLIRRLLARLNLSHRIKDLNGQIGIAKKIIENGITSKGYFGQDQPISAEVLSLLVTSPQIAKKVGHFGLTIKNLTIEEKFDLRSATIVFPLKFADCKFKNGIELRDAQTRTLEFDGGECSYFVAGRVQVNGTLQLKNLRIEQGVELYGAKITGYLDLTNTHISPIRSTKSRYKGKALVLDGASIDGNLTIQGIIYFKVSQQLSYGVITTQLLHKLLRDKRSREEIPRKPNSFGEISMVGVCIGGDFDCRCASFEANPKYDGNPSDYDDVPHAFVANLAKVGGHVYLGDGFQAKGQVLMKCMDIRGDLFFDNGAFECSSIGAKKVGKLDDHLWHSISLDRSTIHGSVFMRDRFKAFGQVRLMGTMVMKNIDCSGGSFKRSEYTHNNGVKDKGYTILIAHSDILHEVYFRQGQDRTAFETDGVVYIHNSRIGADLNFSELVHFIGSEDDAKKGLEITQCEIRGCIVCWLQQGADSDKKNKIDIDLSETKAEIINHDWNVLIKNDQLNSIKLDHFEYNFYKEGDNCQVTGSWVNFYRKKNINPLAIECRQHLGRTLTKQGENLTAVRILIDVEKDKYSQWARNALARHRVKSDGSRNLDNNFITWLVLMPFDILEYIFWHILSAIGFCTLGYGFRPFRSIYIIVAFIVIGSFLFGYHAEHCGMVPLFTIPQQKQSKPLEEDSKFGPKTQALQKCILTKDMEAELSQGYPGFDKYRFSFDNFFSLADLGESRKYWRLCDKAEVRVNPSRPKEREDNCPRSIMWLINSYLIIHRLLGWLLIPLAITGITAYIFRNKNL